MPMKPASSSDNASGLPLSRLLAATSLKGGVHNHPASLTGSYAGREIAKSVICDGRADSGASPRRSATETSGSTKLNYPVEFF